MVSVSSGLLVLYLLFPFRDSNEGVLTIVGFFDGVDLVLGSVHFVRSRALQRFGRYDRHGQYGTISSPSDVVAFFDGPNVLLFKGVYRYLSISPSFRRFFFPQLRGFYFYGTDRPAMFLP